MTTIQERIDSYDWGAVIEDMNAHGCAVLAELLTAGECEQLAALYTQDQRFRSHIHMARHGFGKGEYKYFKYPLPDLIGALRTALYPRVAPIANAWNERMKLDVRYPPKHADYLKVCHDAGQLRPTPLLLQYTEGDFNCLHQDLYGELAFPLQATVLLSAARNGFHRRRICADRTAPAHAEPRRSGAATTRRCRGVRRA